MTIPRRRIVEYQSPFRRELGLQAGDPLWRRWFMCTRRLVMYKLQVRVTVRISADFLNKSACHAEHVRHSHQRESLSVSYRVKNFESSRKRKRPFRVNSFFFFFFLYVYTFNCRAVASVVPYLLTSSSWWRLCGAMLHWIEMILTLTAALQAHATVPPHHRPQEKHHYTQMKHKSGCWERERRAVVRRPIQWKRGGDKR